MAQLSRPYQIGLAAILVLAAVWVVLLQGHSPSSSSTQEPAPVARTPTPVPAKTSSPAAAAKHRGATSGPSAPGVAGLTRAVDKARGAVSISEKNAKQLQEKSAQASSPTASSTPTSTATTQTAPTTSAPAATAPSATKTQAAPKVSPRVKTPSRERAVEAQLAKGKIALILFWNPKGADDVVVHRALSELNAKSLRIAINEAPAKDIAAFGAITRGIQVYGTPTLLIVNKKGQTTTLTGSEDAFAITQAIREARHS